MKLLEGVCVADFSQLVQGPFATQVMGDLGADIVKVEPLGGDWLRHYALQESYPRGVSVSFLSFNRNKRSIAVDLRSDSGRQAVRQLVERSDVVVENFRPGVMDRLGFDYATVASANPRIVYCSGSGWGQDGPYRDRPGQDLLAQAMTGLPYLNGRRGDPPTPVGFGVADLAAGLHVAYSVLAGLLARERTGEGCRIEVDLMSSLMALMTQELTAFFAEGSLPERDPVVPGSPHAGAPYGLYESKDGYVAIAMNDVGKLAQLVGLTEFESATGTTLMGAEGFEYRSSLAAAISKQTTTHWVSKLLGAGLWAAPLQDFDAVGSDAQVDFNGILTDVQHPVKGTFRTVGNPIRFTGHTSSPPSAPPRLGEHTSEVLAELGYSEGQIQALFTEEAVGGE